MSWRISTDTRDERGASAVEFALVVIPLLMVVAGIVNFGVAFANQLSLDNAVRQAARASVVDVTPAPDVGAIVTSEFNPISTSTAPLVDTPGIDSCDGSAFGASLTVTAETTTDFIFPWPLPESVLDDEITLTSEARFQCEFS
ncbi:TadE/TadG family type IV pilus assembly protein [Nocardioides glacieisoli]|uniref:TadE/TadG family type IV pilus assembly protein n=1 Tax=Nocardioides glacieisoli TaxID=1168730 RepID=UPI0013EAFE07|nr:TadE/TadG family type IV pilus assembly protein [Nocardioides glacieisoli]